MSVSPRTFRAHVEYLVRSGYRLTTVSSLLAEAGRWPVAAVTFDDGFGSVADAALPVLEEYGVVGTVFPIVEGLGRVSNWADRGASFPPMPMMSVRDLKALAAAGWEVGAHSSDHRCYLDAPPEWVAADLRLCRSRLSDLACARIDGLSYPQGCHSEQTTCAARAAGYSWACTTVVGAVDDSPDRHRVCRVTIGGSTSMLRFRAAFNRTARAVRRWAPGAAKGDRHCHSRTLDASTFS